MSIYKVMIKLFITYISKVLFNGVILFTLLMLNHLYRSGRPNQGVCFEVLYDNINNQHQLEMGIDLYFFFSAALIIICMFKRLPAYIYTIHALCIIFFFYWVTCPGDTVSFGLFRIIELRDKHDIYCMLKELNSPLNGFYKLYDVELRRITYFSRNYDDAVKYFSDLFNVRIDYLLCHNEEINEKIEIFRKKKASQEASQGASKDTFSVLRTLGKFIVIGVGCYAIYLIGSYAYTNVFASTVTNVPATINGGIVIPNTGGIGIPANSMSNNTDIRVIDELGRIITPHTNVAGLIRPPDILGDQIADFSVFDAIEKTLTIFLTNVTAVKPGYEFLLNLLPILLHYVNFSGVLQGNLVEALSYRDYNHLMEIIIWVLKDIKTNLMDQEFYAALGDRAIPFLQRAFASKLYENLLRLPEGSLRDAMRPWMDYYINVLSRNRPN